MRDAISRIRLPAPSKASRVIFISGSFWPFSRAASRVRQPARAVKLKPLGDGFIALVKMMISPVIFCTVVLGIAGAGDMRKVGRVGGKALIYFEVVSTLALVIGLVVVNVFNPGPDSTWIRKRSTPGRRQLRQGRGGQSSVDFMLHIIPKTFTDAFTGSGDLLQVLFVAILFGYAMVHMGRPANPSIASSKSAPTSSSP